MAYETFIGLRYLKSRRRSNFISVITLISIVGVMLGVATLCIVLSVMNGFKQELLTKVLGANSHGVLFRYGLDFRDHDKVRRQLIAVKGIRSASPIVSGQVMISAGSRMVGVGMKGIDIQFPAHLKALQESLPTQNNDLKKLNPNFAGALPGIAIGKGLARELRVKRGDVVNLVSPVSLFGLNYRSQATNRTFRVQYIYSFGMYQYDSKFCFVGIKHAQKFLNMGNSVSGIEFLVDDIHQIGQVTGAAMKSLGGWPYRIRDWRDMNKNLFKALEQNKTALFIILLFIILVASMNIAGTLIMMIIEKSKDIAILRTMGASRQSLMRVFITYGLYIGTLGTMIGMGLGVFLCQLADRFGIHLDSEVYFISNLPILIKPTELVLIAISALLISFLATIYPAIQAARQKPVDVLRYE